MYEMFRVEVTWMHAVIKQHIIGFFTQSIFFSKRRKIKVIPMPESKHLRGTDSGKTFVNKWTKDVA